MHYKDTKKNDDKLEDNNAVSYYCNTFCFVMISFPDKIPPSPPNPPPEACSH